MSFYSDFISILSWFYPNFIQMLSWFYLDKIWIKGHGRAYRTFVVYLVATKKLSLTNTKNVRWLRNGIATWWSVSLGKVSTQGVVTLWGDLYWFNSGIYYNVVLWIRCAESILSQLLDFQKRSFKELSSEGAVELSTEYFLAVGKKSTKNVLNLKVKNKMSPIIWKCVVFGCVTQATRGFHKF